MRGAAELSPAGRRSAALLDSAPVMPLRARRARVPRGTSCGYAESICPVSPTRSITWLRGCGSRVLERISPRESGPPERVLSTRMTRVRSLMNDTGPARALRGASPAPAAALALSPGSRQPGSEA